jgi:hypothetical protein
MDERINRKKDWVRMKGLIGRYDIKIKRLIKKLIDRYLATYLF